MCIRDRIYLWGPDDLEKGSELRGPVNPYQCPVHTEGIVLYVVGNNSVAAFFEVSTNRTSAREDVENCTAFAAV